MAGKWPYKRVEDIALKVGMGPFGSSIKVETFSDAGIPIISGQHLREAELTDSEFNFITEEHADSLKNANVQRGDVIFTHAGNIGQVAFIPTHSKYQRYIISQRQFYLRCDTSLILPEFIAYYFKSPEGQHKLLANANQVGVPSIARPSSYLRTIEIPVPSIEEQQIIVRNIKALDAKIRVNRHINQTLEAMAQAIFKSWFIDFDPVKAKIAAIKQGEDPLRAAMRAISGKTDTELDQMPREHHDRLAATAALFPDEMQESELGEIPLRWKVVPASTLIEFNPKEPLRKGTVAPYLDMASLPTSGSWSEPPVLREFGSGTRFRNGDALLGRITPCLENGKSAFVQNLPDETVGWGSTEFIVMRSKSPVPREYAYLLVRHTAFRQYAIRSMTGTSGRQRAQADAVAEFQVISPFGNAIWRAFSELLASCFRVIKSQSETSESLKKIRDILLPKLLSGELAVDGTVGLANTNGAA